VHDQTEAETSKDTHINSSDFIVDPSASIVLAVYSSGAIRRSFADDVLGLIKYLQAMASDASESSHAR
jgi:hypothetical protein